MLLHVVATHTGDNCPAYDRVRAALFGDAMSKMEELARRYEVKIHFLVSAAPEHRLFALLETETLHAVGRFLVESLAIPHDFQITVVQTLDDARRILRPSIEQR
ncbi:MAG TPA: hypothetical protein VJM69_06150 [Dehalococcoidia bacterium]|nr:hypothetical protein [Dehalococcoidia bacterium]